MMPRNCPSCRSRSALRRDPGLIARQIDAGAGGPRRGTGAKPDRACRRANDIAVPEPTVAACRRRARRARPSDRASPSALPPACSPARPAMSPACPAPWPAICSCSATFATWCARASGWSIGEEPDRLVLGLADRRARGHRGDLCHRRRRGAGAGRADAGQGRPQGRSARRGADALGRPFGARGGRYAGAAARGGRRIARAGPARRWPRSAARSAPTRPAR